MSFEPITFVAQSLKDVRASISYRRGSKKRSGLSAPRLVIGLPKTVVAEFKFKPDQTFGLLLGKGKEDGRARIVPNEGGVKPKILKGGCVFRFGFVPFLGDSAAEKELVPVSVVTGGGRLRADPAGMVQGGRLTAV
jgi:hypothetical protein